VHEAALPARRRKTSPGEFLEVERERRARDRETVADLASGEAVRPLLDGQSKYGKAGSLGKGGEGTECILFFNLSKDIKIVSVVDVACLGSPWPTAARVEARWNRCAPRPALRCYKFEILMVLNVHSEAHYQSHWSAQ
jgi:hypothetical protein